MYNFQEVCMRKKLVQERSSDSGKGHGPAEWVDRELTGTVSADERQATPFRALLGQLSASPGDSIPLVSRRGQPRKRPTVSSTMTESVRSIFWQDISRRLLIAQRRPTGRYWYCATPRNSAVDGTISRRKAQRASILPVFTETAYHWVMPYKMDYSL